MGSVHHWGHCVVFNWARHFACLTNNTCSISPLRQLFKVMSTSSFVGGNPGLKVNDQLVAYATRFLAVRLKKYMWSHHRALKAKV